MVNKLPLTREEVPKKVYSWRWATKMSGFSPVFFICIAAKLYINLYTPKDFREKLQHFFAWRFLMGRFAIQKGLEGIVAFFAAPAL